ncbi:MAG TPA: type II secretion system protein GspG [Oligoflexus sp.]|uniref:type II secretion system protein GspG n=1 Tax=Oligoflexus sp. TaxID=1971216 RepID=UPI002D7FD321|nr:type II secretion system protein GspG [Oligoflexus sp.]HET9237368.1 type II secretion system protein GspG [Oligoflexus sp.]
MGKILRRLSRPFSSDAAQEGMTIIEILIVIALMSTIMAILVNTILEKYERAKIDLTSVKLSRLSESLVQYKLDSSRFPTTDEGLKALIEAPAGARNWRGPYTQSDKLLDPWDRPIHYELITVKAYKIASAGPDGEFGNEDDITL